MNGLELRHERLQQELERRQHYRVTASIIAKYRVEGAPEDGVARIANLGMGGARVDFPEELQIPSWVTLELPAAAADPKQKALHLRCQVAWTVAGRSTGPYPTGLQFGALDTATKRRLFEYVAELMG
jgi:c-di-GMP-binding flagellar brake protein YcgR